MSTKPGGPMMTVNTSVNGPAVYLDNWAIGELAEGDPQRRKRFVAIIHAGVELLFSPTNAAELSGPLGKSADDVRAFLNDLGPHWFPVELNATEVVERERQGASHSAACSSKSLVESFALSRYASFPANELVSFDSSFFALGAMMDWVSPQRDSIRAGSKAMDQLLVTRFGAISLMAKQRGKKWLDATFPRCQFTAEKPATFVYRNLLRTLIEESGMLKENDGLDFCHAVIGSAFANFAALDKHWKRRICNLPKPNGLAKIYAHVDLDQMILDMESSLIM